MIAISGRALLLALEQMLRSGGASGAQPHLSRGAMLRFATEAAPLHKVRSLTLNKVPIELDAQYNVAITQFMAAGGDGVTAWTGALLLCSDERKFILTD